MRRPPGFDGPRGTRKLPWGNADDGRSFKLPMGRAERAAGYRIGDLKLDIRRPSHSLPAIKRPDQQILHLGDVLLDRPHTSIGVVDPRTQPLFRRRRSSRRPDRAAHVSDPTARSPQPERPCNLHARLPELRRGLRSRQGSRPPTQPIRNPTPLSASGDRPRRRDGLSSVSVIWDRPSPQRGTPADMQRDLPRARGA